MALGVWLDLYDIDVGVALMLVSGLTPPVCTAFVVAEWLRRRRAQRLLGQSRPRW
jgi:hypothetical protein